MSTTILIRELLRNPLFKSQYEYWAQLQNAMRPGIPADALDLFAAHMIGKAVNWWKGFLEMQSEAKLRAVLWATACEIMEVQSKYLGN